MSQEIYIQDVILEGKKKKKKLWGYGYIIWIIEREREREREIFKKWTRFRYST